MKRNIENHDHRSSNGGLFQFNRWEFTKSVNKISKTTNDWKSATSYRSTASISTDVSSQKKGSMMRWFSDAAPHKPCVDDNTCAPVPPNRTDQPAVFRCACLRCAYRCGVACVSTKYRIVFDHYSDRSIGDHRPNRNRMNVTERLCVRISSIVWPG